MYYICVHLLPAGMSVAKTKNLEAHSPIPTPLSVAQF